MLIVGIFFGFFLGFALVASLQYAMHLRSRDRSRKDPTSPELSVDHARLRGVYRYAINLEQAVGIHLLNMLQEEGFKKLCGNSYPSSTSFLTFEKVNWFNTSLGRMWPYIVEATEPLVKEILGPILEQYRPPGISSLKLDQFHIGKVPPLIDGVRVQSLRKSQVIMDMDFKWGGDASIILSVNPVLGPKLPVQLRDLSLFTTIRVIFQLSEGISCISALVVALLAKPKFKIKYNLKVIGGSTGAIPGLGDMIEDLVESSVIDQLEWPHRFVIPIGSTPSDMMSDLELKLQGKLRVTVVRCTDLKNMEKLGKSDPYVRLYVRVLFKSKTRVIYNNLNPEWNQVFNFDVEDTETQNLVMQVKDEDMGTDKLLGVTSISLHDLEPHSEVEITKKLSRSLDTDRVKDKGNRGTVTVKLMFQPYTKAEQAAAMEAERKVLQAKEDLKKAGVLGGAMDAVGSGAKIVSSGIGEISGAVGSSVGIVGSGLGKAGKLMSAGVKRHFSSNKLISSAASTPVSGNPMHDNETVNLSEL